MARMKELLFVRIILPLPLVARTGIEPVFHSFNSFIYSNIINSSAFSECFSAV